MSYNIDLEKIRGALQARGYPLEDLYEGPPPHRDNATCHLDLNNRNVVAVWSARVDLACLMALSTELSRKPKTVAEQLATLPRARREAMLVEILTNHPSIAAAYDIIALNGEAHTSSA